MQAKAFVLLALVAVTLADNLEGPKHVEEEKSASPNVDGPKNVDDAKKDKRGLLDLGIGYASPYTVVSGPSVVTTGVHTNTVITKEVPVIHPVAVPVEKPVPVIQKVAVPVDRPFAVQVPKAVPVPVEVSKPVAVPVPVPVHVPVVKHVVSAPYPVVKQVSVSSPVSHTYVVEKHHSPLTTTYTVYN